MVCVWDVAAVCVWEVDDVWVWEEVAMGIVCVSLELTV